MNNIMKKSIIFVLLALIAKPAYPAFGVNTGNKWDSYSKPIGEVCSLVIALGAFWIYYKRYERIKREEEIRLEIRDEKAHLLKEIFVLGMSSQVHLDAGQRDMITRLRTEVSKILKAKDLQTQLQELKKIKNGMEKILNRD